MVFTRRGIALSIFNSYGCSIVMKSVEVQVKGGESDQFYFLHELGIRKGLIARFKLPSYV